MALTITVIRAILYAFIGLVFTRSILSWFPPGGTLLESVRAMTARYTDWAMAPVRRYIPPVPIGGVSLDLAPLVVLFAAYVLLGVLPAV